VCSVLQRIKQRIGILFHVPECESYFEAVFDLHERSESNVEKSSKFVPTLTRCALYDVGRTRKGGSADLGRETI